MTFSAAGKPSPKPALAPNQPSSTTDGKPSPTPAARLQEEPAVVDGEDGSGWEEDNWGDMDVRRCSSPQHTVNLFLLATLLN